jgi:hypothetical protein
MRRKRQRKGKESDTVSGGENMSGTGKERANAKDQERQQTEDTRGVTGTVAC